MFMPITSPQHFNHDGPIDRQLDTADRITSVPRTYLKIA
jgi:hypothetical protein